MTLHQYLAYAAVTSPIILVILILTLTFKSWLDKRTFRSNTAYAYALQKHAMKDTFDEADAEFDAHVASTPGMQNL
jgi:hypothetical protein